MVHIKQAKKNLTDYLKHKDFAFDDDFKEKYDKEDYPDDMCQFLNDFSYEKGGDDKLDFKNFCLKF